MRVAFLVNAHANFLHLQRLLAVLLDFQAIDASIFVHIDATASQAFSYSHEKVHVSERRLPVYWGGMSQVRATLLLLEQAFEVGGFEYFCFITGQDYPVRSGGFLAECLSRQKNFINLVAMPARTKPIRRLTSYWLEHDRRKPSLAKLGCRSLEVLLETMRLQKKIPFFPYAGSQHFFLRKDCVEYILSFCANNQSFLDFHKTALCPDESFFQTIIGNSPFAGSVEPSLVYANWASQKSNFRFSSYDLDLLKARKTLSSSLYGDFSPCFARKFFDSDVEIIERVRSDLLGLPAIS